MAEVRRRMKSWGSQVDLADELEREPSLSHELAGNEGEPLDYDDAISLTSSDPVASALLVMPRKSRRCLRVRKLRLNSLKPPALRTKSCWRLWNAPRRGFTCRGSEPRWWRCRDASMSDTSPAINPQLR